MASMISSGNLRFAILPGILGQAFPAKLICDSSATLHQPESRVATVAFRRLLGFWVFVRPVTVALFSASRSTKTVP